MSENIEYQYMETLERDYERKMVKHQSDFENLSNQMRVLFIREVERIYGTFKERFNNIGLYLNKTLIVSLSYLFVERYSDEAFYYEITPRLFIEDYIKSMQFTKQQAEGIYDKEFFIEKQLDTNDIDELLVIGFINKLTSLESKEFDYE